LDVFREFRKSGGTIVLVSHSVDLIVSFCEKSLYLLNGRTRSFGDSREVEKMYRDDIQTHR